MDLRHGLSNTWRRSSQAPLSVRSCSGSPVTPVQRRSRLLSRQAAQPCQPASPAALSSGAVTTTVDALVFGAAEEVCQGPSQEPSGPAVLQTRLSKAHSSATSAALVVQDTPDEKLVATASLDKGMAIWRFYSPQGAAAYGEGKGDETIEVTRLKVPGAPVFSLAKIPDVLPDGTIVRKRPKPSGIYLGTSSKEVLTWMLGSKDVTDKVVLDGHTGWVRSLAVTGKWLFSCGCNFLRQWDTTFRTPKEVQSVRLFTGDILAIEASNGRVFTAGADGALRSWTITRTGALEEGPRQEHAHEGRVAACVAGPADSDRVFTVSYDGSVKAWSASTLEPVAEVRGAHGGEKIFCAAVGPFRVLFTGGDDKLIRAWDMDLNPIGVPLDGHAASVRVLAAGRRGLLVSGDSEGDVCVWEMFPVALPQPPVPVAAALAGPELVYTEAGHASAIPGSGDEAAGPSASAGAMEGLAAAAAEVDAGAVEVSLAEAAMAQLEDMLGTPQPQADPGTAPGPAGEGPVVAAAVEQASSGAGPWQEEGAPGSGAQNVLALDCDPSSDGQAWGEAQPAVSDLTSSPELGVITAQAAGIPDVPAAAMEVSTEHADAVTCAGDALVGSPPGPGLDDSRWSETTTETPAQEVATAQFDREERRAAGDAGAGWLPGREEPAAAEPLGSVSEEACAMDRHGLPGQEGGVAAASIPGPDSNGAAEAAASGGDVNGNGVSGHAGLHGFGVNGHAAINGEGFHAPSPAPAALVVSADEAVVAVVMAAAAAAAELSSAVSADSLSLPQEHQQHPAWAGSRGPSHVDQPVAAAAALNGASNAEHMGDAGVASVPDGITANGTGHVSEGWAYAGSGTGQVSLSAAVAAPTASSGGGAAAAAATFEHLFASAAQAAAMGAAVDMVAGGFLEDGGHHGVAAAAANSLAASPATATPLVFDPAAAVAVPGAAADAAALTAAAAAAPRAPPAAPHTVFRRIDVENVAAAVAASCLNKEALARVVPEGRPATAAMASASSGGGATSGGLH